MDDRHGEDHEHRGEGKNHKQRVFHRSADVLLVFPFAYTRVFLVVLREQDDADAVNERRRDRGEELVGVVHCAHRAVSESCHGRGVGKIAPQEDARRKHRYDGRAEKELHVRIAESQRGIESEFFLDPARYRHCQLQYPCKTHDEDVTQHILAACKQREEHDQQNVVRQTQTSLQRVVFHGLEHGNEQINEHDQRQREHADLHIGAKNRRVRIRHVQKLRDRRKLHDQRQQCCEHEAHNERYADQVACRAKCLLTVGLQFFGDDRDGGDAQSVGHGREDIDRIVV